MIVEYQWSEDGEVEICRAKTISPETEFRCYHCDQVIPAGSEIFEFSNLEDGAIYHLHKTCSQKSARIVWAGNEKSELRYLRTVHPELLKRLLERRI